jgi:hypothetical protein
MLNTEMGPGGASSMACRMRRWTATSLRCNQDPGWSYSSCQSTQFISPH